MFQGAYRVLSGVMRVRVVSARGFQGRRLERKVSLCQNAARRLHVGAQEEAEFRAITWHFRIKVWFYLKYQELTVAGEGSKVCSNKNYGAAFGIRQVCLRQLVVTVDPLYQAHATHTSPHTHTHTNTTVLGAQGLRLGPVRV